MENVGRGVLSHSSSGAWLRTAEWKKSSSELRVRCLGTGWKWWNGLEIVTEMVNSDHTETVIGVHLPITSEA